MIKIIAATTLSAVMAITSVVPVQAFPVPSFNAQSVQVEKVQWSNDAGRMIRPRHENRRHEDRYRYWHGPAAIMAIALATGATVMAGGILWPPSALARRSSAAWRRSRPPARSLA